MCRKLFLLISFVLVFGVVAGNVAIADPDLVSYYKLDESSGNIAGDISGNDNDGRVLGDANWAPAGGKFAGAAVFYETEDTYDQIEIPIDPNTTGMAEAMTAEQGTVAMWIKSTSKPSHARHFFGHKNSVGSGNRIKLYMGAGGDFAYYQMGDATVEYMAYLSLNTWNHIAVTWDQNDTDPNYGVSEVYVDGDLDFTHDYIGLKTLSATATIANSGDQSDETSDRNETFAGLIDDVGLWKKVLNQSEITAIQSGITAPTQDFATEPNPGRGDWDVSPFKVLSWTPGATGDPNHDVYFGTDFNDVNEATRLYDPCGVLLTVNQPDANYTPASALTLGQEYSWRIDEVDGANTVPGGWEGTTWSFTVDDGKASDPDPDDDDDPDSDDRVASDVLLEWVPGTFVAATAGHEVYLGTSEEDVNTGTGGTSKGAVDVNEYQCSGLLAGVVYYWRVDQKNVGLPTSKGDVWAFMTQLGIVLDDFEDYTNDDELKAKWERLPTTAKTYLYLNTDEPHDGDNCMRLKFCADYVCPGYSAARLDDVRSDWIVSGNMAAFGLWYMFEDDVNDLYVEVTDGPNDGAQTATVIAAGNDPNMDGEWYLWNISYEEFENDNSNIDLNDVDKLTIGVTCKDSSCTGYVYFDDVLIYAPRYIGSLRRADGDVRSRSDGMVDGYDVERMVEDWLVSDYNSIGYDGFLHGSPTWMPSGGKIGGGLEFHKDTNDYVDVDDYALGNFQNRTICMWIKNQDLQEHPLGYQYRARFFECDGDDDETFEISLDGGDARPGHEKEFRCRLGDIKYALHTSTKFTLNNWHHVGFVLKNCIDPSPPDAYDNEPNIVSASMYFDGLPMEGYQDIWFEDYHNADARAMRHNDDTLEDATLNGNNAHDNAFIDWTVDDFRIFNYSMPDADVLAVKNDSYAGDPNTVLLWYKFDETSGDVVHDFGFEDSNDIYHPLDSPGNLYDEEEKLLKKVNFMDYAVLAQDWLVQELWPDPAMVKNCRYEVTNITPVGGYTKCPRDLGDECHKAAACDTSGDCAATVIHWYGNVGKTVGCCVTFTLMDCSASKEQMCPSGVSCP